MKQARNVFLFTILSVINVHHVLGGFSMADNCRIFCNGPLLDAVQKAHLFHDAKDFVDMSLKHSPKKTLLAFERLVNKSDGKILGKFVEDFFIPPGSELEKCNPRDWVVKPKSFERITDSVYRHWAYIINTKWRSLCRKVKETVKNSPELFSLIPIPHPFIAPGGRFREFYYWDTYWIIKGLLASEMTTTAKNMIRNLGEMIKKYGFVPNGGRVYYLRRTQPPLLSGCVMDYFKATGDIDFLREMLPLLDKEYQHWNKERTVKWITESGERFELYQYRVYMDSPRPESYKEDLLSTSHLENEEDKIRVWSDIAAACESGWDFSSRWFAKKGPFKNNIRGIRTSRIIPVDLNAFMCWNSFILSKLHSIVGNTELAEEYGKQFEAMKIAISKTFWNERDGTWYDLDLDANNKTSRNYYASNLVPLFTHCLHDSPDVYDRVVTYLKGTFYVGHDNQKVNADSFPGGLATSLTYSGEQWDSSNGWAPTNHMVIEGLRSSESPRAQELAFELAKKWIETNYFTFVKSGGKMFEKYDIESLSSAAGGGGEYEVQEGFGWTNGVILDLLLSYGDRLIAPPVPPDYD